MGKLWILVNLADLIVTTYGVSKYGAYFERNPIVRSILSRFGVGGLWFYKGLGTTLLLRQGRRELQASTAVVALAAVISSISIFAELSRKS